MGLFSSLGSIAGGIAGSFVPGGTAIGATLGGSLGGMLDDDGGGGGGSRSTQASAQNDIANQIRSSALAQLGLRGPTLNAFRDSSTGNRQFGVSELNDIRNLLNREGGLIELLGKSTRDVSKIQRQGASEDIKTAKLLGSSFRDLYQDFRPGSTSALEGIRGTTNRITELANQFQVDPSSGALRDAEQAARARGVASGRLFSNVNIADEIFNKQQVRDQRLAQAISLQGQSLAAQQQLQGASQAQEIDPLSILGLGGGRLDLGGLLGTSQGLYGGAPGVSTSLLGTSLGAAFGNTGAVNLANAQALGQQRQTNALGQVVGGAIGGGLSDLFGFGGSGSSGSGFDLFGSSPVSVAPSGFNASNPFGQTSSFSSLFGG